MKNLKTLKVQKVYTPKVAQAQCYLTFRKGKWAKVEIEYFQVLVQLFSKGLLDIPHNYPLRVFLAHSMACDPMRISKKFVGKNQIGKQRYVKKSNHKKQQMLRERFHEAQLAFKALLIEKNKDCDIESRVLWPNITEAPVTLGRIANYYNDPALLCHGCNNYQRQVQNLVWYDTGGDGTQYCFRCNAKNKKKHQVDAKKEEDAPIFTFN
tara:strand:- start:122 stop:748 length:627 start_codon:yes stop_codon:yes gene_type:complete